MTTLLFKSLLSNLFTKYSVDGAVTLDTVEALATIFNERAVNRIPVPADLESLVQNDPFTTADDFVNYLLASWFPSMSPEDQAKLEFKNFDVDGNGFVSIDELRHVFKWSSISPTDYDEDGVMDLMTTDFGGANFTFQQYLSASIV